MARAKSISVDMVRDSIHRRGSLPAIAQRGSRRVARGMKVELPHPIAGRVPLVASPMRFSSTPIEYECPPPTLGEHTDAILREWLGYDDLAIAQAAAALGRQS